MTTTELIKAVLHVSKKDFHQINDLATKIVTLGIFVETTLYATPTVTLVDFQHQLSLAIDAVALGDKGIDLPNRDKQSGLLFKMLKKLINYVNGLYEGDEVNLLKSGFDVNRTPAAHPVADQLVIKRIQKHNEANSVKIMLEAFTGLKLYKKEKRNYKVYVFATAETDVFKIGFSGPDSRKIIVKNVPVMISQWYAITVTNSAGESLMSARVKFTLTD